MRLISSSFIDCYRTIGHGSAREGCVDEIKRVHIVGAVVFPGSFFICFRFFFFGRDSLRYTRNNVHLMPLAVGLVLFDRVIYSLLDIGSLWRVSSMGNSKEIPQKPTSSVGQSPRPMAITLLIIHRLLHLTGS